MKDSLVTRCCLEVNMGSRNRTVWEYCGGIVPILISQRSLGEKKHSFLESRHQNFGLQLRLPDGIVNYFPLHLPDLSQVSKYNVLPSFSD